MHWLIPPPPEYLASLVRWLPSARIFRSLPSRSKAINLPLGENEGSKANGSFGVIRVRSLPLGLTLEMPGLVSPSRARGPFLPGLAACAEASGRADARTEADMDRMTLSRDMRAT